LGESRLELSDDLSDRIATLEILRDCAQAGESFAIKQFEQATVSNSAVTSARYNRLGAEIALLKETRKLKAK
jgi:hypothetical protein